MRDTALQPRLLTFLAMLRKRARAGGSRVLASHNGFELPVSV